MLPGPHEHARPLALLAVLYSSRAALCPAAPAPAPAARSSPPPLPTPPLPLPLPQVERALLQGEGEEGPDELESLVRSLGQQLRSSRWVEEELARKAAAGEPLVRIFGAADEKK